MSRKMYMGSLGLAATDNDRFRPDEPSVAVGSLQALKDREATPDLLANCPICGNPYRIGSAVVALATLSFPIDAAPFSSAVAGCDPSIQTILGHHECVLPRLLTLLAGFQPEARFVRAFKDSADSESVFPERSA